jgi:chromate transporter
MPYLTSSPPQRAGLSVVKYSKKAKIRDLNSTYLVDTMNDLGTLFEVFITFLKIGAVMFGGGYAMIPILRYEVVVRHHWLSESEFLDLIAVAESTPGPIAINSATYIGYKVCGVLGSIAASVAVILPPFFIILAVAVALQKFYGNYYVRSVLNGIRGAIIGLVTVALITVVKGVFKDLKFLSAVATTIIAVITFLAVAVFDVDPVIAIAASALLGLVLGLAGIWLL